MAKQRASKLALNLASHARKAAAAGALLALSFTHSAKAEIIRVGDMLRGIEIHQAQCSSMQQSVWVSAYGQSFCIRYYLSTVGGAIGKPIVFLQGDQFGTLDTRTGTFNPPENTRDIDTSNLMKMADAFSKASNGPAIYLARIGVDGSSGHHRVRRTILELHTMNAALDAIRQRHNFDGFHLVGQSGGSGLIGGLLALRGDIACAVPGAGRLSLLRQVKVTGNPGRDYFDPIDAIGMIAANRSARIIVVTDPSDKVVGVQHQVAFVNAMRREGRAVEQYFVQSTDEKNHGVLAYAGRAVVLCAQNAPSTRIATDLDLLVKKRLVAAQQGRNPAGTNAPALAAMPPRVYAGTPAPASVMPMQPPATGNVIPIARPNDVRTDWPKITRMPRAGS